VQAMVLSAPGDLELRDVDLVPDDSLVTVRVDQVGVCGTDRAVVDGSVRVETPRIIGHEVVGRVHEGRRLGHLKPGDRVLVDPSVSCGRCRTCRRGLRHLCPEGGLMGRDADGGLADLVAVPFERLHRVPEGVGDADAALLQVLGTCVHAQRAVPRLAGSRAVVVGLGVSGLLHVQLLRAWGAATVVGVGRSAGKRRLAEQLGATATCGPDEAAALVSRTTDGQGADVVVEAVGSPVTVRLAVELAGPASTVVVFGTSPTGANEAPLHDLYRKELRLLHPRAATGTDYDDAVALVASGSVRGDVLVTERLPIAAAPTVFATWHQHPDRLKVVFSPGGSG
jgi:L-iditol 2-dehydrogenase